ncbi:MAG: EAL domain-containing protein, partial [Gammaproteobacteria bacterium]|nr:EAL domain-containing protein [Gammaproteobacteria bacterium]
RLFGTLCFMGTEPRHTSFTDTDKDFLRLMAQWVGTELERQASEKILAERQELFRLAHNFAGITTSEVDLNNNVLTWHNPLPGIFGSNSGFEPVQMPLDQFFQRFHPDDLERVKETLWTGWKTGQDFNMKYRLLWPDGSVRWREVYGTLIRDDNGQPSRLLGIALDITEHKEIEARLDFLAHRDTLTGLVNRAFFQDYLQKTLRRADRHGSPVALLFLDLDQFKQINDTLGHDCGDELLKAVGNLLTHCVRKMDAVARLGGDEFAIVLEDIRTVEDAIRMAEKILQSLASPVRLSSGDVFINTSIGIACYDPHNTVYGEDATTLIKQADIAMYHAKGLGRGAFQVYNEELSRQLGKRRSMEIALRKAVKDEAFVVHYQPQVELKSGRLVGMEALIRWAHSGENLVLPEEFISVAEETGLILPIGAWILKTVCRQIKTWTEAGYPPLLAAVNVSLRQFQRGDIVALVTRTLQDTGLAPERIKLEVTESILMSSVQRSAATLETLRTMGVKIEVDDFGTGHSSLAYLKQLPLDALKIDQSFVHELNNKNNRAIVRAVINMARSLDLRIIAEGVETDAQRDFLAREGCDEMQGNLIGPPVPAAVFEERYLKPAQNRDATSAAPSPDLTAALTSNARE